MMRKHLPEGMNAHNLNPDTLECPVCSRRLVPSELVIADGDSELWYVECRNCGTEYLTRQPLGKIVIPTPINRDYVLQLEQRILRLEQIILRINHAPNDKITHEEEVPNKYAFLLNT